MTNTRRLQRSFVGGIIGPSMFSRVDDGAFDHGAKAIRNMVVRPDGSAQKRPGTKLVRAVKTDAKRTRLIPFTFSTTQTMAIELGEGYIRFHTQGATLLASAPAYVESRTISSWDTGTGQVTWSAAHGLSNDEPVQFTSTVSLPEIVVSSATVTFQPAPANTITWTGHGLQPSDTVQFTSAGSLPSGVVSGQTYIAIPVDANRIKIRAVGGDELSFATAGSGTHSAFNRIGAGVTYYAEVVSSTVMRLRRTAGGSSLTSYITAGTGTITGHRAYSFGDVVTRSGSSYYCTANTVGNTPPNFLYWYLMPASGVLELPTTYVEADLFAIHYAQSNDVLTLVHPNYPPKELRRLGANRWTLTEIVFGPTLGPPRGLVADPTRGGAMRINGFSSYSPLTITFPSNHPFQENETVYVWGTQWSPGPGIQDGYYSIGLTTATTARLKDTATGAEVSATGTHTALTGSCASSSLSADNSQTYCVTSIAVDGSESIASATVTVANNLLVTGSSNLLSWSRVTGAVRYRVYKQTQGLFGYIGQVDDSAFPQFRDDNIEADPDLAETPPILDTSLGVDDHPGAVGYYEQRRAFAGTGSKPQDLWLMKSGSESDLSYSLPVQASDRIYVRVSSRESSRIRHIVPMGQLLMLTNSAEYRIAPTNEDALSPDNISVRPQSYIGANDVQPLTINNTVVFAAERGGHIREMGWRENAGGYATGDLCLRAPHLFDNYTIQDAAYQRAPYPILWFVSSSGSLLGCTYVPEEGVGAWHEHTTDGVFESVCVVAEGQEDAVYVVVKRKVGGVDYRFVERFEPFAFASRSASYFVDCGLTYTGGSTTTITGLSHLASKTVRVLSNGTPLAAILVGGDGSITVPSTTLAHVGLEYTAEIESLPLAMQIDAFGQGRTKNINRVWPRVFNSGPFTVGPDADKLVPSPATNGLLTQEEPIAVPGSGNQGATLLIRQTDPLPLTITGLTLEVAIGS